ncbi:MAG: hypothetical protein KAR39_12870 [Thermoplasmata archaeon]|nr:hypothetical protein [Thermoplasmata archaeon]
MKFRTLLATLLLLVVTLVAQSVQGVLYPDNEILNQGTAVAGTFPTSIRVLDVNYRQYAPTLATPSLIRLTYEFDLNPLEYNRLNIIGRVESVSGQADFRFRVLPSATYTYVTVGLGDALYTWDLTTQQAQSKPVEVEFEFTCVPGGVDCEESALYLDHVFIQSWNSGEIVVPPGDEQPEDNKTAGDDTSFVDSDWFDVVACLIIFLIAFALLTRVTKPVRAFALAGLIAIFSFVVLTGWIFALLMTVVMK